MATTTYGFATVKIEQAISGGGISADQSNPDIAVFDNGAVNIVYTTQHGAGTGTDFALRKFDAFGNPLGGGVTSFPAGDQAELVIAPLSSGSFFTAGRSDSVVNSDGGTSVVVGVGTLPSSNSPIVIGDQPDNQTEPAIAGLAGDRRVIVWTDPFLGDVNDRDIRVTVQNNAGTLTYLDEGYVVAGAGVQRSASVAAQGDGFVVTWSDDSAGADKTRIVAHRYNQDGDKVGGFISIDNVGDNDASKVIGLFDGGFAVVYEDTQHGGGKDISLRIFNADGSARTGVTLVNSTLLGDDVEPTIAQLPNGFLTVSWSHKVGDGNHDLYMRAFSAVDGAAIGGYVPYQTGAFDQRQSSIANAANGRTILTWNDSEVKDEGGSHIAMMQLALRATTVGDGTDETIAGSALQDEIQGLGGKDAINGFGGEDKLEGGAGDDFLTGGMHNDVLDGGAGRDAAYFGDKTASVVVTLNGAFDAIVKVDNLDEDIIRNIEDLYGGSAADTLMGDGEANLIQGRGGADTLDGAGGVDTVSFADLAGKMVAFLDGANQTIVTLNGVADDKIRNFENAIGGETDDVLVGDGLMNILRGMEGNDFLHSNGYGADGLMKANAGADTLEGGNGNDGLFGGDGSDALNGGAGNDGIVGGGGADTLNGDAGVDFLFGGAFGAGGVQLANSGVDVLNGGADKDGLYGFDGADILNGDAGDDYIEGGAGADILNGGADADFLLGQDGVDVINGGAGFDYLYGGAQGDTFVFRKGDSADWILDFKAVDGDKLKFDGFGFANIAAIPLVDLSSGGNLAVGMTLFNESTSSYDQLTVFGVSLAQLNAGNVLFA